MESWCRLKSPANWVSRFVIYLDLCSFAHQTVLHCEQFCLSTAASQPIEAVAAANDEGASIVNESNSVHSYNGPNGGQAKSPRFFQLYMGHDDEIVRYLSWPFIVLI